MHSIILAFMTLLLTTSTTWAHTGALKRSEEISVTNALTLHVMRYPSTHPQSAVRKTGNLVRMAVNFATYLVKGIQRRTIYAGIVLIKNSDFGCWPSES